MTIFMRVFHDLDCFFCYPDPGSQSDVDPTESGSTSLGVIKHYLNISVLQEEERKAALKRERLEQQRKEVEEEFVGKELKVKGKVEQWKGTYGFIR